MKNSFKIAFLAIAVSAVACKGKGSADSASDTSKNDTTVVVDSTVKKDTTVVVDTTKKDTTKK
ncbi:hypothetical protein ACVW0P_001694 [Mucilaginibacter sp. UYNi724]